MYINVFRPLKLKAIATVRVEACIYHPTLVYHTAVPKFAPAFMRAQKVPSLFGHTYMYTAL